MLKQNQFLIAAAESFVSTKSGVEKNYNVLQVIHYDRYNKLKAEAVFTNAEVVKQFEGSGIYNVETVYGQGIVGIKKVSGFEL